MSDSTLSAGVVGVGSMGQHHARTYSGLPDVDLVGVADADSTRAAEAVTKYGTVPRLKADLFADCDIVSVAVPTRYHCDLT